MNPARPLRWRRLEESRHRRLGSTFAQPARIVMTNDSIPYPRDMRGYGPAPRPILDGRTVPESRSSSSSTTRRAARTACCTATRPRRRFCPRSSGAQPLRGVRHMNMESIYEYGSRAGFWRLWRMFTRRGVSGHRLRRGDGAGTQSRGGGGDARGGLGDRESWPAVDRLPVSCRWTSSVRTSSRPMEIHARVTGTRPLGWYTGRTSPSTRDLVKADGGFFYDSDSYADDLPYWEDGPHGPHLVVPYTLDANDMRFATAQGFNSGDQFPRLSPRQLRYAVPRGGGESEDDVGGAPLPAHRKARPCRGARSVPRPRRRARGRMGDPAHRHRQALARAPPTLRSRRASASTHDSFPHLDPRSAAVRGSRRRSARDSPSRRTRRFRAALRRPAVGPARVPESRPNVAKDPR